MNKILYVLVLSLLSFGTYSQEYVKMDTLVKEFFYDYNFQQDSTDYSSEIYQEMVLQIGKHTSKFISVNLLYSDSLTQSFMHLDPTVGFQKLWSKIGRLKFNMLSKYVVYKNYPELNNTRFIGALGSKINLEVNQNIKLDWQYIEQADTIIMNLNCNKAICNYGGRQYQAWYTLDIPISNGPYKFGGLPGLIVKLHDIGNQHVFQLNKIRNTSNSSPIIYEIKPNITKINSKGFTKAMSRYLKDLYVRYGGNPNIKYSNPDDEAKTLRNIRSKNNFIERY